ncbi:MAG TPA: hypothetical protein ENN08_01340 [Bacteroidales bacterium]|nr:hypothetical protein [Bacteroidales bacterium]
MAILSSNTFKFPVLIIITLLIYIGWHNRLEPVYARILVGGTNIALNIVKTDTSVGLEKEKNTWQFRIQTRIDGRRASFPQVFGGLLQPFVIVLSWQLFLFMALNPKQALQSLWVNVGIYYLLQIIFMIFLTGYHTSELQQFIYVMFVDSFYIIALVLILKDNMLYPVFMKPRK